ncbi:MAG: DUF4097 family beta strand repeat-containing protein [bacterium]
MRMHTLVIAGFTLLLATGMAQAKDEEKFDLDKSYSIDPNGTIYLTSNDAEVTIVGSDRKDVHVFVEYRLDISGFGKNWRNTPFGLEVTEENGNLRIRDEEVQITSVGIIRWNEHYVINIEAPSTVNLRLRFDDDNIRIRDISGDVSLSMSDGRAMLERMSGKLFELEADDGTIELDGGQGTLDVTIDDGSVYVTNGAFKEIMGRVGDGEIEIATKIFDDGRYRLHGDDGELLFEVLDGGGEFNADFDDGHARASGAFKEMDRDDHYLLWSLPGGKARVDLRVNDGRINLRKK